MLQSCENSIDNKGFAGAAFMDLSKVFHFANHGFLLAKLSAYGLNSTMLMILLSLHDIQTSELLSGNDCSVTVKRFSDNLLKFNDEKCHLMVFGIKTQKQSKLEI